MSRRCELTGKAVQSGNKVSHFNRKTRRRFLPNFFQVTLISDTLERACGCASARRRCARSSIAGASTNSSSRRTRRNSRREPPR